MKAVTCELEVFTSGGIVNTPEGRGLRVGRGRGSAGAWEGSVSRDSRAPVWVAAKQVRPNRVVAHVRGYAPVKNRVEISYDGTTRPAVRDGEYRNLRNLGTITRETWGR